MASTWSSLKTSVTMGRFVLSDASFKYFTASKPSPWKSKGLVLGLKAPPLRMSMPLTFKAFASSIICSRDSMEQGPAIIIGLSPPTFTSLIFTIFPLLISIIILCFPQYLSHQNYCNKLLVHWETPLPLRQFPQILLLHLIEELWLHLLQESPCLLL